MARGILAIWHDIAPEQEADTLDWYDREHHFERLDIPGFLNVRRYQAEPGASPQLFIRYETENPGVLASAAYLDRLNQPTPWTLRCQPQFRNNSRTVCERVETFGRAEGGVAITVRLTDQKFAPSLRDAAFRIAETPGILGWERWVADVERSVIPTREKQLRGGEDRYIGSVAVFHARGTAEAAACLAALQPTLAGLDAGSVQAGIYRLAFAANNFVS